MARIPGSGSGSGVRLFPRRKRGDEGVVQPTNGRAPMFLENKDISVLFNTPQAKAAETLGISITTLKQVCRKLGITRWPYARRCSARPIHDLSAAPAQPAPANCRSVAVASESDDCSSVSGHFYTSETAYTTKYSVAGTCSSEDSVADSSDSTDDLAWLIGASSYNAFANDTEERAWHHLVLDL